MVPWESVLLTSRQFILANIGVGGNDNTADIDCWMVSCGPNTPPGQCMRDSFYRVKVGREFGLPSCRSATRGEKGWSGSYSVSINTRKASQSRSLSSSRAPHQSSSPGHHFSISSTSLVILSKRKSLCPASAYFLRPCQLSVQCLLLPVRPTSIGKPSSPTAPTSGHGLSRRSLLTLVFGTSTAATPLTNGASVLILVPVVDPCSSKDTRLSSPQRRLTS